MQEESSFAEFVKKAVKGAVPSAGTAYIATCVYEKSLLMAGWHLLQLSILGQLLLLS